MNWSQLKDIYWKFYWIYTRIFLFFIAGVLILWLIAAFVAFCFDFYRIVVLGRDDIPIVALPALAVGLLVAGAFLWLVLWAIRKSRGGAASPMARWTREIQRSFTSSRAFRILMAIAVAGSVAQLATAAAVGVHAWLDGAPIGFESNVDSTRYPVVFLVGFAASVSGFASIATLLLAGVPFYLASRRYGYTTIWHYVAAGVVLAGIGAGIYVATRFVANPPVFWEINPTTIATLYLLACPLAAMVFWLIARPDRVATAQPTSSR